MVGLDVSSSGGRWQVLRSGRAVWPTRHTVAHGASVLQAGPSVLVVQCRYAGCRRAESIRAGRSGVLHSRNDAEHQRTLCHDRRRRELQDRDADQLVRINNFWLRKGLAGSSAGRSAVQPTQPTSVSGRTRRRRLPAEVMCRVQRGNTCCSERRGSILWSRQGQ